MTLDEVGLGISVGLDLTMLITSSSLGAVSREQGAGSGEQGNGVDDLSPQIKPKIQTLKSKQADSSFVIHLGFGFGIEKGGWGVDSSQFPAPRSQTLPTLSVPT
jgi:hypothetical protein